MQTIKVLTLAAALTGAALFSNAAAAAQTVQPVVLEGVIVTPTASYTAAEWQARLEARAAPVVVTLERVIVTPSRSYTVAEWHERQALMHAGLKPRLAGMKTWLKTVWKHFVRRTPVEV